MSGPASTQVLVTGDTHVTLGARLPDALLLLAERADAVLHTGDCVTADVLDTLGALAPLTAVAGNCDGVELLERLGERAEVEIGGVRFGLVHDGGPRTGRHDRLRGWFPACDVLLYGHSHDPEVTGPVAGTWILNPGSPVQRRRAPFHSAIWLELRDGVVVRADLVNLDAPLPGTMSN